MAELEQVKQMVLRDLPRVLQEDPGFVVFIEGILSEKFPRRDEFARMLDELQAMRHENDERFGRIDQRFDQIDRRFEQVDQRFEQVVEELRGVRAWCELNVGRLEGRIGRRLEDVVAGAFRYGLERSDIQPEHVKLRQKVTDQAGLVFRPGRQREVDIIAIDGEIIVFEVKSAPDDEDIEDFADKVTLVRHQRPDKKVSGVFVALGAEEHHRQLCASLGLRLIP